MNLAVARSPGLLRVTLDRPDKRNALTAQMQAGLADAFALATADPEIRVVLLRGRGDVFCAGNDLAELAAGASSSGADDSPPLRMLTALRNLDAVLVAAVHGPAVGVGATLLLHCDLVYASSAATIRYPFTALGLVPEAASTLLLPQVVGRHRAAELILLNQPLPASTAHDWGLFNEVLTTADALSARVEEVVTALLALPPAALAATRKLLHDEEADTVQARLTLDAQALLSLLAGRAHGG